MKHVACAIFAFAICSVSCTDQNVQSDPRDDMVADTPAERSNGYALVSTQAGASSEGGMQHSEGNSGDFLSRAVSSKRVVINQALGSDSGDSTLSSLPTQSICQGSGCGPQVKVRLPMVDVFQEGSGSPTDPIELRAILEFYSINECLRAFVEASQDIRQIFRSGCSEEERENVSVGDGQVFSLGLPEGQYYVRIRGHDGSPYSHLLFNNLRDREKIDLEVRVLAPLGLEDGVEFVTDVSKNP